MRRYRDSQERKRAASLSIAHTNKTGSSRPILKFPQAFLLVMDSILELIIVITVVEMWKPRERSYTMRSSERSRVGKHVSKRGGDIVEMPGSSTKGPLFT